MRLVKLSGRSGDPIWVNPAQVATVTAFPIYDKTNTYTHDGSRLRFALAGESVTVGGATDHEPYTEIVTEPPATVAGLFLSPCGRDAS